MSKRVTRRDMLRYAGLGGSAVLLAACAPKVIKETVIVEKPVEKVVEKEVTKLVEKVVKETIIVKGTPKVVEKVVKETVVVQETVVVEVAKERDVFQGDLLLWHNWGNKGGGGLAMLDQVEAFMKLHPKVKMVNVFDAGRDKFLAAIAGGNPPDLLKMDVYDLIPLGHRGALMALDPLIDRDNWDMSQYFDFALDQCSWRDKTYAITHHPDVRVLYRDKQTFSEVGLDPEKEPQSWDDLYKWGMEMSKQEGGRYQRFGFVVNWTSNPWATQYMLANGVQLLSEDGHKATFTTEAAEEAMSFVLKCVDDICGGRDNVEEFKEIHATPEGKGPYWMFPRHRIGMVQYGNWLMYPVGVINPEMEVGIGSAPGGYSNPNKRFVFGGGTMVTIPSGAKHWELAWEWLKFLGGPEGAALVQARTADISGRKETARDPEQVKKYVGRKPMVELFEKANALSYLKSPIVRQWDAEIRTMGDRILLKEVPIKQALAEAQNEVQKALDEFWATA